MVCSSAFLHAGDRPGNSALPGWRGAPGVKREVEEACGPEKESACLQDGGGSLIFC